MEYIVIDKYMKTIEFIADNMVYCTLDKCIFRFDL